MARSRADRTEPIRAKPAGGEVVADVAGGAMPLDQRQCGLGQRRQDVEANGVLIADIAADPAAGALPGVDPIARFVPACIQGNSLMAA